MTVESGSHFSFHYMLTTGVVFLTLSERAYPKRLAFDYLEELRREFFTVYGSQVIRASRPYEFIRFDTFIQKTKKVYGDSRTQRNLDRINTELRDVHTIMTKNINDVISRGEKLESKLHRAHIFDGYLFETPLTRVLKYRCRTEIYQASHGIEAVRSAGETRQPHARRTAICARGRRGLGCSVPLVHHAPIALME